MSWTVIGIGFRYLFYLLLLSFVNQDSYPILLTTSDCHEVV
jgi:hypothetical protein